MKQFFKCYVSLFFFITILINCRSINAWADITQKFYELWVDQQMAQLTKQPQNLSKSLQDEQSRFFATIKTQVPLVTGLGKALEPKNILILAYGKDYKMYPHSLFANCSNSVYQAFQRMTEIMSSNVPFSRDRMLRRLAQQQNVIRQLKRSQYGIEQFPTGRKDIMIISYKLDDQNKFAQFLNDLNTLFKLTDPAITILSYGENASVVNKATRLINFTLDGLLYVQSPIYSYKKGLRGYSEILEQKPANYAKLINMYTKTFHPVTDIYSYPDRKYRADFAQEYYPHTNKVANISALKINKQDELAYLDQTDLVSADFVLQIPALIHEVKNYSLNFDLAAIILDQTIPKKNILQSIKEKKNFKTIFVNRFVELKDGNLALNFGDLPYENYILLEKKNISPELLKEISARFQQELNMSMAQLDSVQTKPSAEGRYMRKSQIAKDITAVKDRHMQAFKSSLFENYRIADLLNNSEFVLNKFLQDSTLSTQFAANNIIQGGNIAYNLLYLGNNSYNSASQRDHLNAIIALMWYFYGEAINKNEPFTQGAFVIKDPNFVIYNFLMSYVKKVNPAITSSLQDPALANADNPFAYSRISSHYKHLKNKFRQYGIDARFESQSGSLPFFPLSSRHLLFGIIDEKNQLLYIKPENYGIYGYAELAHHGVEFGQAQMVKLLPKFKFAFNKEWYQFLEDVVGTDDSELFRKERIPQDFVRQFLPLILDYYKELSTLCQKDIENMVKNHSVGGIQEAVKFNSYLHQLQKDLNSSLEQPIDKNKIELINRLVVQSDELVRQIDNQYDHITLRTGREVILGEDELFTSLYYYLVVHNDPNVLAVKDLFNGVIDTKLILRRAKRTQLAPQYYAKLSALSGQVLTQSNIEILKQYSTAIFFYINALSRALNNALNFAQKIPNPALRTKYLTPRYGLLSYDYLFGKKLSK